MNIDNPAALHFIMQDDIFLLKNERELFESVAGAEVVAVAVAAEVVTDRSTIKDDGQKAAPVVERIQPAPAPEPVTPVLQQPVKQAPAIKYRGANKSGYVVLVHYPAVEWMDEAHLAALENTLKRKNIEPADVAIINMAAHSGLGHNEIIAQFKPHKLLLMGKAALPSGIGNLPLNQLQQLANLTALYTFSFDEMMSSNENKKIFWEQMKVL